jgi:putative transposase
MAKRTRRNHGAGFKAKVALEAVKGERKEMINGEHPQIFNTDQDSQFTSDAFTKILKTHNIRISMDGRGRWMDNVFNGRLWKSVKYEDISRHSSIAEARRGLTKYFDRYNIMRRHQGLDNMTPDEVYWNTIPKLKKAV